MVGRLSPELRDKTVDLMVAAARKDSFAVADALYAIGRPTKKVDMSAFRAEVALLAEKYVGRPLREIELSALIRDLVGAAVRSAGDPDRLHDGRQSAHDLRGHRQAARSRSRRVRRVEALLPRASSQALSPCEIGNDVRRGIERFAGVARDVPVHLHEVLDDLRMGRLQIRTAETQSGPVLDRLGRRLFSGMVVASLNVAAGLALVSEWRYRVWAAALLFAASWIAWAAHVSKDAVKTWWAKGKH